MVKLREAKCPSCGANIEVNEELEKAMCQYCGSTIMVEEAIEKIQVELSGKVKVSGIRDRDDKLQTARNHRDLGEYDKAEEILNEIINEDAFDVEVLCELAKNEIDTIEKMNFEEYSSRFVNEDGWIVVDAIATHFERAKKTDKENSYESFMGDYLERANHYEECTNKLKDDEKRLEKIAEKINSTVMSVNFLNFLDEHFNMAHPSGPKGMWGFTRCNWITREGIIYGHFHYIAVGEAERWNDFLPSKWKKIFSSVDEIENLIDQYIAESNTKHVNDLKNNVMSEGGKTFARIWIILSIIATIYVFVNCGWLWKILMVFADFLLIGIPKYLLSEDDWAKKQLMKEKNE